jgi:head-tail adaptor
MDGAGELDRKITILRAAVSRDEFNNEVTTWPPFLENISAKWRPATAREQLAQQEVGADVEDVFEIRWWTESATINPRDRLQFGERVYDIAEVTEIGRRNRTNVVAGSNAVKSQGIGGGTITAGQVVYRDATSKKFLAADADSATAGVRDVFGIALHGASLDQPLMVQTEGDINLGATLAVGTVYVLSGAAGAIAPSTDLSTGEYTTVLGVASAANNLEMKIVKGGAAVP